MASHITHDEKKTNVQQQTQHNSAGKSVPLVQCSRARNCSTWKSTDFRRAAKKTRKTRISRRHNTSQRASSCRRRRVGLLTLHRSACRRSAADVALCRLSRVSFRISMIIFSHSLPISLPSVIPHTRRLWLWCLVAPATGKLYMYIIFPSARFDLNADVALAMATHEQRRRHPPAERLRQRYHQRHIS